MKILVTPDKFLRIKAKPVVSYDKKLEKHLRDDQNPQVFQRP